MTAQARLLGGRYQVGELLGYGGMAEVHRGRDLRLGRDVAIKMLRTDLARDATFQMRFRREAQNAAVAQPPGDRRRLRHRRGDRGRTGETLPFIVMEFVNGRTLKEVLGAEGRLQPRRALEITADICAALEFSHRHGIIHRDIKPGNVMLTQTGQVKVMDFGIARALASGATTMTQTSAVIGTAQYLSPEQARGEAVDARSRRVRHRLRALRAALRAPAVRRRQPGQRRVPARAGGRRPRRATSTRTSRPTVDAIVLKALAKNPLNRYQSAGEMRADLLRAAAGRPVSATPVLTEDEMTAMIGPPQQAIRSSRQPLPPSRDVSKAAQRQRRRNSMAVTLALVLLSIIALGAVAAGILLERNRTVQVPTITGLTEEQATAALRGSKLDGARRNEVTTTSCAVGKITSQDPPAGARGARGREGQL